MVRGPEIVATHWFFVRSKQKQKQKQKQKWVGVHIYPFATRQISSFWSGCRDFHRRYTLRFYFRFSDCSIPKSLLTNNQQTKQFKIIFNNNNSNNNKWTYTKSIPHFNTNENERFWCSMTVTFEMWLPFDWFVAIFSFSSECFWLNGFNNVIMSRAHAKTKTVHVCRCATSSNSCSRPSAAWCLNSFLLFFFCAIEWHDLGSF